MDLLGNDFFQLGGIPLILAVLSGLGTALASRERNPRLAHWSVAPDLCLEALAMSLALAVAYSRGGPSVEVLQALFGSFVLIFVIWVLVVYVLRFVGLTKWTFVGTMGAGVIALWGTVALWRL